MRIGVIGAGHAGVEAANAASNAGADVVLFSAESSLPYYRPRLVALSFGQVDESAIVIHPAQWYAERGIDLRMDTAVESLDVTDVTVMGVGKREEFDALVMAIGAAPAIPPFIGGAMDSIVPLWTIKHARSIREKASPGANIVTIGGGVIGIETVIRATDAGMNMTIVEKMERVMSQDFGEKASDVVRRRLEQKGIHIMTGRTVTSARARKHGGAVVELADGETIEADLVLVSVGVTRDLTLARQAGLETDVGIMVDTTLRTSAVNVFACGDVIQIHGVARCSAREAAAQGKTAGLNACAALSRNNMQNYRPPRVPLTFKYKDFEIHSIGAIPDHTTDEIPLSGANDSEYRARIVRDGVTVGVQMVGSGKDFQKYAKEIEGVRYDRT